jgi:multidrug transporter EmrE-like cation transporter
MSTEDLVLLAVVEVFGDMNLSWYAKTNKPFYLASGISGYIGVVYYLIKCLQTRNLLYVNGMWDGISTIVESLAAFFVLGNRLDRPEQYIGLALIIGGLLLLKETVAQ